MIASGKIQLKRIQPAVARVIYLSYVLFGISFLSFGLFALAPGDPAEIILRMRHEAPTLEQIAELRLEMGLDQPLPLRYVHWLSRAAKGDLGRSWQSGEPVCSELAGRLPATLELTLASFGFIVVFSTAAGVLCGIGRNGIVDQTGRMLSILAMSVPSYWLGFLLVYCFAMKLGWLPVMGRGGPEHLLMPAVTLGLAATAMQGRVLRASLIEVLGQDHVRFAVAKGLKRRNVLLRHVLRNAMGPVATLWGISLGNLLAGSAIVETVFSWPGLGRLIVNAILSRDIPMLQGAVLVAALAVAGANLAGDVVQRQLNPRLGEETR
ncbi:MAG: ABC transporter permease [Deltaproteobacteria bacterium]|nr:ABC transporter permease [Deltaproteobacteria bacterium]